MATQFQVSISAVDDLNHWEIVNRSDFDLEFDDDEVSACGVESLDSFSFTYSSPSDVDVNERDHGHLDAVIQSRCVDDVTGEESSSFDDVIDPNDHVVVDVMREESRSSDVVSVPDADDDDVMSEESRSSDDVISLRYHADTLSDVSNHVVDDDRRLSVDDVSDPIDDDALREELQSSADVINSRNDVDTLSDVNNHVQHDMDKNDLSVGDDVMSLQSRSTGDIIDLSHQYVYNPYKYQNYDFDNCDADEAEYEDDYDLDDELVPWGVKDRFERQRLRKSGKRSCVKMMKAKQSTLLYTKPGCVRGKHGFGVKVY